MVFSCLKVQNETDDKNHSRLKYNRERFCLSNLSELFLIVEELILEEEYQVYKSRDMI